MIVLSVSGPVLYRYCGLVEVLDVHTCLSTGDIIIYGQNSVLYLLLPLCSASLGVRSKKIHCSTLLSSFSSLRLLLGDGICLSVLHASQVCWAIR